MVFEVEVTNKMHLFERAMQLECSDSTSEVLHMSHLASFQCKVFSVGFSIK